jgi:pSer/pThr/pTyr-binding forkhead associated (FHA) protein
MILKVVLKFTLDKKVETLELNVGDSLTIGRSSKSVRKINDEQLSSCHCKFELTASGLLIEDLNSKNGTYLNKIRIEKSEMFMGDEIRIGKTKIAYDPTKMDTFSRELLAFPGGTKERVNKELKVDFTGARIQNQLTSVHNNTSINRNIMNSRPASHFQKKEIEVRKKASSMIKLSKEQIKAQNKIRASFASLFDLAAVICLLAIPVIIFNYLITTGGIDLPGLSMGVKALKEEKFLFMGSGEIFLITLFFFFNFKISKFSFGEKVAGIQKKYKKQ